MVSTSSPAANSVEQLAEMLVLNYMALQGVEGQFSTLFPQQGLGSPSDQAGAHRVPLDRLRCRVGDNWERSGPGAR